MVDQWKIMVDQWNRYGGTVEEIWQNSETDMVEQWNRDIEQRNRDGGTLEQ